MNYEEFKALMETKDFREAKTMPNIPHSYTLRKDWEDEKFVEAVKFIRKNGYIDYFYSTKYIYFDLGEHRYWTMGSPIKETILINKAKK